VIINILQMFITARVHEKADGKITYIGSLLHIRHGDGQGHLSICTQFVHVQSSYSMIGLYSLQATPTT